MTCCIEKSSIFAAAFGKCIYKVSNIQYYFNQKNMNYSCRKTIVQAPARTMNQPGEKAINKLIQWY